MNFGWRFPAKYMLFTMSVTIIVRLFGSVYGKMLLWCLVVTFLPQCLCQNLDVSLSSTESTATLAWIIQPNATSYQVTWFRSIGIFFTDYYYNAPFTSAVKGKLSYSVFGLVPGAQYTFSLYQNGNTTNNKVSTDIIATVPLPPENLNVLNQTSTSVFLTWDKGYNSTQELYKVEYQDEGTIRTLDASIMNDPLTFNVTGLKPGHTYLISMRAFSFNQISNSSAPVTAITAPASPVKVKVTAVSSSRLNISWEPDNTSLQSSYQVYYGIEQPDSKLTNCTTSPCDFDVNGIPGQLYVISVYALQQSIRSMPTVVQHNSAPATPRNLNGVSRVRTLLLSWDIPNQGVFDFFRLVVTNTQANTETVFNVTKNGTRVAYSYSATGLLGGLNYFVRVFSVTTTETSLDSISHLYPTLPEPIRNLTGNALNTTAVRLSWLNPAYSWYNSLDINVTAVEGGGATSDTLANGLTNLMLKGLNPGAPYTVVAVIKASVGVSSVEVRTVVRSKPELPQLISYETREESISLNLTGGANPKGVYSSVAAKLREVGKALQANQSGIVEFVSLTPGTVYTLDAYALSEQESSESLIKILHTRPRPPTNVQVAVMSSSALRINWDLPDKGGVDNYTVTLTPYGTNLSIVKVVTSLSLNFTEAMAGETYNITVVSNKGGESSSTVMKQETTYPESVAALQKMDATTNSIVVNWTAPLSGKYSSFQLSISANIPNKTLLVSVNQTNHTYVGLVAGMNYTIGMRTMLKNLAGNPGYGEAVLIYCVTRPKPVRNVVVETLGTDSLKVQWSLEANTTQDQFLVQQENEGISNTKSLGAATNQTEYEQLLDGLKPGLTYRIKITAIREIPTDREESDTQMQTGTTAPLPVVNVTVMENNQMITITWQPAAGGHQSSYRVRYRPTLRDPNDQWLEQSVLQPNTQFSGVFPGERYQISIYSVSAGVTGQATNATIISVPLPPSIAVDNALTTTRNVTVKWTHNRDQTYVELWLLKYSSLDVDYPSLNITNTPGETDYSQQLTQLTPGVTYTIEVIAMVMAVSSTKKTFHVTSKPVINTNIVEVLSLTNNTALTIDYSVAETDVFDTFLFTLLEMPDLTPRHKAKGDTDTRVWFYGLTAGHTYTVQAMTMSNKVLSDPITQQFLTVPNNVKVSFSSKAEEVTVIFGSLDGLATRYLLQCLTSTGTSCWDESVSVNKSRITVSNLLPYTNYSFTVVTFAGEAGVVEKSVQTTYQVKTLEAVPTAVRQVQVKEDGLRMVQISWVPPVALNGELRSYRLEFTGSHPTGGEDSGFEDTIPASQNTYKLTNLKAGFTYSLKVQARTVELGPPGSASITLSTANPAYKMGITQETSLPLVPTGLPPTITQLTVQLVNAFADDNGPITGYAVIVSKDASWPTTEAVLPSWKEAMNSKSVMAYQFLCHPPLPLTMP